MGEDYTREELKTSIARNNIANANPCKLLLMFNSTLLLKFILPLLHFVLNIEFTLCRV